MSSFDNTDIYFCKKDSNGTFQPILQFKGTVFSTKNNEMTGGGSFIDDLISNIDYGKVLQHEKNKETKNTYFEDHSNKSLLSKKSYNKDYDEDLDQNGPDNDNDDSGVCSSHEKGGVNKNKKHKKYYSNSKDMKGGGMCVENVPKARFSALPDDFDNYIKNRINKLY